MTRIELDLLHREPGFLVAVHEWILVIVWAREMRVEDYVEHTSPAERALRDRWGTFVVLTMFGDGFELRVSNAVREAAATAMREFDGANIATAHVIEGGGIRGTMLRTAATTVQLLARSMSGQRMFDDVAAAVDWLLEHPGLGRTLDTPRPALVDAVRSLVDSP